MCFTFYEYSTVSFLSKYYWVVIRHVAALATLPIIHLSVLTGALETVQQRLWDNFSKQMKEEQGLYYCHLMALGAALARCSVNGQARAADYHCQLILHAISHHFYSVLRPKILATTEMVRFMAECNRSYVFVISHRKAFVISGAAILQARWPFLWPSSNLHRQNTESSDQKPQITQQSHNSSIFHHQTVSMMNCETAFWTIVVNKVGHLVW